MSAKYIVLVGNGIQINLTPKMRAHLQLGGLIYRPDDEKDDNKEVYFIEDDRSWDDVNARLSELSSDELNINPPHAPVVHIEDRTPNFDAATPIADYAVTTNVDIPEDDPLREEVDNKRKERNDGSEGQVSAFRVAAGEELDADELRDEVPDTLEEDTEDEDDEDEDDTGNVLFNTDASMKEPDYDEVVQSYDVLPPEDRDEQEDPSGWPEGWYAVAGPSGIEAFFEEELDANCWRLYKINVIANQHNALKRYNAGFGRV